MLNFFRKKPFKKVAEDLYREIIKQAREKEFYLNYGVADTSDGRFDLILIHACLLFKRLNTNTAKTKDLSQAIFDLMFADMDISLRELGLGDIGVNHRIKGMVKAFYGRMHAYEKGLDARGDYILEQALRRNLYRKTSPENAQITAFVEYMRKSHKFLEKQSIDDILSGQISFSASESR